MAMMCVFTSCLSGSSDTTYYDDVAITSFSLGTVKCTKHTTTSAGKDSTYTYSYSASSAVFRIDHVNHQIFNEDSLIAGTRVSNVLASIYALNNGYVMIKNLTDDNYTYYSTSDSIDFSQPRILRVVSSDGNHHADYTVNVNVHNEYADSFTWQKKAICSYAQNYKKVKAAYVNNTIFVLGTTTAGACEIIKSADGASWVPCKKPALVLPESTTMAAVDGELYVFAANTLYKTTDGESWTTVASSTEIATLAGGSKEEMYAMGNDGAIYVSKDQGNTWVKDELEDQTYNDNTDKLPYSDITVVAYTTKTNSDIKRMTMVGNKKYGGASDTYTYGVVWNKVVDMAAPQTWTFNSVLWSNHYYILPRMENLSVTSYAEGLLAIGGAPINNSAKAYQNIYYSPDFGTTWHVEAGFHLPSGFTATDAAAIVGDGNGFFYVIAAKTGEVWLGRQNKQTWNKVQKIYK